jgi:hypothetical protein
MFDNRVDVEVAFLDVSAVYNDAARVRRYCTSTYILRERQRDLIVVASITMLQTSVDSFDEPSACRQVLDMAGTLY